MVVNVEWEGEEGGGGKSGEEKRREKNKPKSV